MYTYTIPFLDGLAMLRIVLRWLGNGFGLVAGGLKFRAARCDGLSRSSTTYYTVASDLVACVKLVVLCWEYK
jgi:hypothetical protein